MSKVTMLKPGVIQLPIGTGFVKSLQELAVHLIKDIPSEKMDEYKKLFEKGTMPDDYPEEWMKHVFNLSLFLKTIKDAAVSQGLTYDKDIDATDFKVEDLMKE